MLETVDRRKVAVNTVVQHEASDPVADVLRNRLTELAKPGGRGKRHRRERGGKHSTMCVMVSRRIDGAAQGQGADGQHDH